MKRLLCSLLLLVPFPPSLLAASNLDEAANDVCKCLEAPYAQAEKAMALVQQAQASGDMSQLMAAQGDMMGVISASGRCFEGLSKKYPDIDRSPELQDQVMAKADQKCPNPAKQFQMR
ncbi:MAG: hypothetical protein OQJ91_05010 [Motiliproteus sp.]|nr:hypothetical protein [Motiliproteus sp.]